MGSQAVLYTESGKRLKSVDNGDGTETLATTAGGAAEVAWTGTNRTTSGQVGAAGAARLHGWSVMETAGSGNDPAAKIYLRDGTDATGAIKAVISLGGHESDRQAFERGIACALGVYLDIVSGAIEITVYTGPA